MTVTLEDLMNEVAACALEEALMWGLSDDEAVDVAESSRDWVREDPLRAARELRAYREAH